MIKLPRTRCKGSAAEHVLVARIRLGKILARKRLTRQGTTRLGTEKNLARHGLVHLPGLICQEFPSSIAQSVVDPKSAPDSGELSPKQSNLYHLMLTSGGPTPGTGSGSGPSRKLIKGNSKDSSGIHILRSRVQETTASSPQSRFLSLDSFSNSFQVMP